MNFLSGWIGKAVAALGVLLGIIGALFAVRRSGRSQGRMEAEHEQAKEAMDAVQEKSDLDRSLADDDARRKLREKHYRD